MKKLLFILLLPFIIHTQDTMQLTPQELFDYNSRWNNLGNTQSYVDYSKDVLSSSDISLGYVDRRLSTTINLSYHVSSSNGKWNHTYMTSINPVWKYYGIGYGISRIKETRKTTLQTIVSTDFVFQKNITVSIVDIFVTRKFGKIGYAVTASNTFWGEWEGPWEGQFVVDSNGNWVSNIYPINPASSQLTARAMLMYTYPIKTKLVEISPQVFTTGDIYKVYRSSDLNISYWDDFNLDIYYGLSMNWKITKKFVLNTNVRLNSTVDNSTTIYKKSNPILLMIGTSFKL
jgi:hypothetical protein